MEKRDLYNIERQLIGKSIYKTDEIPENTYILMVVIFIQNNKNEFLIQKRSSDKGGLWATTGGHPKSGETSLQGIITEVKEELNIDIDNPILFKQASGKNTLCDLYFLKKDIDINEITFQKEEVDGVKWASLEEIEALFKTGLFNKGHYMMFKDCLEFINK